MENMEGKFIPTMTSGEIDPRCFELNGIISPAQAEQIEKEYNMPIREALKTVISRPYMVGYNPNSFVWTVTIEFDDGLDEFTISADDLRNHHMMPDGFVAYIATIYDQLRKKHKTVFSQKGYEWQQFSQAVLEHIESYTLTQYGDSDGAIDLTPEQIVGNIQRYLQCYGKNARGAEEQQRDFLKIAHYACLLAQKHKEVEENE